MKNIFDINIEKLEDLQQVAQELAEYVMKRNAEIAYEESQEAKYAENRRMNGDEEACPSTGCRGCDICNDEESDEDYIDMLECDLEEADEKIEDLFDIIEERDFEIEINEDYIEHLEVENRKKLEAIQILMAEKRELQMEMICSMLEDIVAI